MEVRLQTTARFEKDLKRLSERDQVRVREAAEQLSELVAHDRPALYLKAFQPQKLRLRGGLDSTLYALRVGPEIRVLLTIDSDPVFEEEIITLLRVAHRAHLGRVYRSVAESLYQELLLSERADDEGGAGDS